ncbi:MAG: hypothetical protein EA397_15715 [Deltaproteobacteria bacterium]|nr:MAG: hypothetical protein EA397_15715 [Deltaproteobacteria bacterium]
MLILLTLLATSLAHPLGLSEWSLRTGLHVGEEGLTAMVIGEVPVSVVARELREAGAQSKTGRSIVDAYTAKRQAELIEGSELRIDGKAHAVRWVPAPSPINGKAVDGFFVYAVVARVDQAELPSSFEATLSNRAWPRADLVYAADVRTEAPWSSNSASGPTPWGRDPGPRSLRLRAQRLMSTSDGVEP